jgi:hypothetical protein
MNSIQNLIRLKEGLKSSLIYAQKRFSESKPYIEHLAYLNELADSLKTGVDNNE